MTTRSLDKCDLKILDLLQRDASIPLKRLAELCHVSEATGSRRVAALKKSGYLGKQVMLLDRRKLGLGLSVYVLVAMEHEHTAPLKKFEDRLRKHPNVMNISFISGDFDYLMHIVVKDMQEYHDFAEAHFVDENHVKKYHSMFEMKSLKDNHIIPINIG
jgi:DNA-binding Lrp family transcriptional regulator